MLHAYHCKSLIPEKHLSRKTLNSKKLGLPIYWYLFILEEMEGHVKPSTYCKVHDPAPVMNHIAQHLYRDKCIDVCGVQNKFQVHVNHKNGTRVRFGNKENAYPFIHTVYIQNGVHNALLQHI
jgi:hypothetical protein